MFLVLWFLRGPCSERLLPTPRLLRGLSHFVLRLQKVMAAPHGGRGKGQGDGDTDGALTVLVWAEPQRGPPLNQRCQGGVGSILAATSHFIGGKFKAKTVKALG